MTGLDLTAEQRRIVELAKMGEPPAQIARRFGVNRQTVYKTLRRARDAGVVIPLFRRGGPLVDSGMKRLSVDRETYAALAPIAAARGLSVIELGNAILRQAARKGVSGALNIQGDGK